MVTLFQTRSIWKKALVQTTPNKKDQASGASIVEKRENFTQNT